MRHRSTPSASLLFGCVALWLLTPVIVQAQDVAPSAASAAPKPEAASAPVPVSEHGNVAVTEPEAAPAPPTVDLYAEAKERVGRAEKLYEDGNFDAALTEFTRAYETMLGHPARPYVLYNIGRCEEKLYRYTDAVASYKRYLREAGEDAEDRSTVEAKVELLEGLLGTLNLTVSAAKGASLASYEVWVDGRLIGENEKHLLIPGGSHQVEIRSEGFENKVQEVQLPSRAEKSLTFELTPLAAEYRGISPVYFWTAGGVALASAITGGVFGVLTVAESSSVNNKDPAAVTQDDKDKLDSLALTADIFFISAGVFAVSATVLGFLTDWSEDQAVPVDSGFRLRELGAVPTSDGGLLMVGGSF